jgi:hypothetical protein
VALGKTGGAARAARMTPKRRKEIAKAATNSLHTAGMRQLYPKRRICRYLDGKCSSGQASGRMNVRFVAAT